MPTDPKHYIDRVQGRTPDASAAPAVLARSGPDAGRRRERLRRIERRHARKAYAARMARRGFADTLIVAAVGATFAAGGGLTVATMRAEGTAGGVISAAAFALSWLIVAAFSGRNRRD